MTAFGYIYLIRNTHDGKVYVGQSRDMARIATYMGSGVWIRRAIRKHGRSQFTKTILQYCESAEHLNIAEQHWIKEHNSHCPDFGYNLNSGGGGGAEHCPSVRAVMSQKAKGNRHACANAGSTRGPHSQQTKEKIRQKAIGNCRAQGHQNAKGWHPSESHQAALLASRLGIPLTEIHKERISQAQKGRQFSEQTRLRMSAAAKNRWERERT